MRLKIPIDSPARVLAAALLLACASSAQQPPLAKPPLTKPTPRRLTRTDSGRTTTLVFQPNSRLISFEITPAVPTLAARTPLWKPLLDQFFREDGHRADYLLAAGLYPELRDRLATAAACSANWNPQTGRPRSGPAAAEVRELINANHLTPELDTVLDSAGYRVSVDTVENVSLCREPEVHLDPAAACHPKLAPAAQLPCGASLVFRLDTKH